MHWKRDSPQVNAMPATKMPQNPTWLFSALPPTTFCCIWEASVLKGAMLLKLTMTPRRESFPAEVLSREADTIPGKSALQSALFEWDFKTTGKVTHTNRHWRLLRGAHFKANNWSALFQQLKRSCRGSHLRVCHGYFYGKESDQYSWRWYNIKNPGPLWFVSILSCVRGKWDLAWPIYGAQGYEDKH